MELNNDNVFALIQSDERFPVDFDDAWPWIGYTRKDSAKDALLNAGFIDGIDFQVFRNAPENPRGGRPSEGIKLTVDCFKSFCMMAGTAKGQDVRAYFIRCETELRQRVEAERAAHKERVIKAVVDDRHHSWEKRFEDEFFDEAYRITGWQRTSKGHPACMGRFINENVYDLFPEGVSEHLREVNPKNDRGNRSRKHHQHLTETNGLPLLDFQKGVTIAVMRLSPANSKESFKRNMRKACGGPIQLNFPYLEDVDAS